MIPLADGVFRWFYATEQVSAVRAAEKGGAEPRRAEPNGRISSVKVPSVAERPTAPTLPEVTLVDAQSALADVLMEFIFGRPN